MVSGRRKFDRVSDVIDEREWLHADNMYIYHRLMLISKMLATSEPPNLAASLVRQDTVHARDTRNGDMLVTPAIRSESGRRRFLYSAVSEYNELPPSMRCLSHVRFKSALRKLLLSKQRGDQPGGR